MIKKEKNQFILYSGDGSKKLGSFPSKEAAVKRENEIKQIKYLKEHNVPKKKKK